MSLCASSPTKEQLVSSKKSEGIGEAKLEAKDGACLRLGVWLGEAKPEAIDGARLWLGVWLGVWSGVRIILFLLSAGDL